MKTNINIAGVEFDAIKIKNVNLVLTDELTADEAKLYGIGSIERDGKAALIRSLLGVSSPTFVEALLRKEIDEGSVKLVSELLRNDDKIILVQNEDGTPFNMPATEIQTDNNEESDEESDEVLTDGNNGSIDEDIATVASEIISNPDNLEKLQECFNGLETTELVGYELFKDQLIPDLILENITAEDAVKKYYDLLLGDKEVASIAEIKDRIALFIESVSTPAVLKLLPLETAMLVVGRILKLVDSNPVYASISVIMEALVENPDMETAIIKSKSLEDISRDIDVFIKNGLFPAEVTDRLSTKEADFIHNIYKEHFKNHNAGFRIVKS
jgi:hypothetical protein